MSVETVHDSLPYYDRQYDEPEMKAKVNQLIQQEMAKMQKETKAKDIQIPNYEKIPETSIDKTRYVVKAPENTQNFEEWEKAIQNLYVQLEYQRTRKINLELMAAYCKKLWAAHNYELEMAYTYLVKEYDDLKNSLIDLHKRRKINQIKTGAVLDNLENKYLETIDRLMQIKWAIHYIKHN